MLDGHEDVFFGNTVVLTGSSVGKPQCDAPGKTTMGQSITNYKLQTTNSVKKGYCTLYLVKWARKCFIKGFFLKGQKKRFSFQFLGEIVYQKTSMKYLPSPFY